MDEPVEIPMEYRPLDSSKDEIRLFRRVSSPDGTLSFALEHFPLSTAPPYWAFSYVWGDRKCTFRILINNHEFEVTENLIAALTTHVNDILEMRAHMPDHPHFQADDMWVDAICIDQRNSKERAEQILRMGSIFRKGIVCVYLNTVDREAYQPVNYIFSQIRNSLDGAPVYEIPHSMWPDLVEFFSKDWFHRMWMIQEFIISDTTPLMLFLGGHKSAVDWELRDAAWTIFNQKSRHITIQSEYMLLSGIKQYLSLAEVKDRIKDGRQCSFLTLLWVFRDRLVSNPRDKIYSLLGLLDSEQLDGGMNTAFVSSENRGLAIKELLIDYEATIEDVYASLVKAVVIGTRSLNIICACQSPGHFVRSWVPDWRQPWSRLSLIINSTDIVADYSRETSFRASAGRSASVEFTQALRSIRVAGTRHSVVSRLGTRPIGQLDCQWLYDWYDDASDEQRSAVRTLYGNVYSKELTPFILSVCAANTDDDGFYTGEALAVEYYMPYLGASMKWKEMVRTRLRSTPDVDKVEDFDIDIRMTQMLDGRKVFIGDNGYCGLVPDHTEIGDIICVLFGCDVPVVIRQKANHYIFVGECYARGLMYGEAMEALERGSLQDELFEIF